MNKFEKIKNMSEEELAAFLTNISGYMNDNDEFIYDGPTKGSLDFKEAIEDFLDWFKQEVKEKHDE